MLHAVVRAVATAAALFCGSSVATAQDYPTRPIKVIATSSAGGTSDIFMRALGDEMQKRLGQPIVIENRPGGAFNIGTRACAEAPPDGYTLCIIPGEPLVFSQFLFKTLNFDPAALEPVTQLFLIDQVLVVGESLKVKSVAELAALSKAKPGTLSYSTAAVPLGVLIERMKKDSGIDMVRVPFRGGGEAVNALLSGTTPVGFYGISNVRAQLEAGTGHRADGRQRQALAAVPRNPDHCGSDRQDLRSALVFRPARARRHAEGRHREVAGRDRGHHGRAGIPAPPSDRARARAGREHT